MKPIRIFRHAANEGPGYLATYLDSRRLPYEIIRIDAGDAVPERLDDVSGIVFMGGPMSVNDDLPWIKQELGLIRRAAGIGMPVLGHCLGGQLISKALGGSVSANPVKEIGWHPVERHDNVAARAWLGGLPKTFEVFHWHGETFSLPPGAALLLHNEYCAHQAFAIGPMLALQCHIEMTGAMVTDWVAQDQAELAAAAVPSVQTPAAITLNLPARIEYLHGVARIFYRHWLRPLDPAGTT